MVRCVAGPVVRSLDFHVKCPQFFNCRIFLMKVSVLGVKGLVLGIHWLERRATASATGTEIPEVVTTQSITQK